MYNKGVLYITSASLSHASAPLYRSSSDAHTVVLSIYAVFVCFESERDIDNNARACDFTAVFDWPEVMRIKLA